MKDIKIIFIIFNLLLVLFINIEELKKSFFLRRDIKPSYKIIGISYANNRYMTQRKNNKKSAIEIGKVDEYYGYGPEDIDKNFYEKNKDILSRNRGNGYWLWKPYFILKALKEKLNDGDYLIYTDAGSFYLDDVKKIIQPIEKMNKEMWSYKLTGFKEREWTKRDAFILMGADSPFYYETDQFMACFQIYKKSKFTIFFVEEYLYYSQDKRIITDEPNTMGLPNYNGFRENRHDQSIFSILTKKYGQSNSGKMNMNISYIQNLVKTIPFIFCHYRRMSIKGYEDLKQKCIKHEYH